MMIRPYGPPSPAPAGLGGSTREYFRRNVDFLCNIQASRSVYIQKRGCQWRCALGPAKLQDLVLPAGRIKARHENFRLESFPALLAAVERRLIVAGRNVQNEPNSRRRGVGRGPRGGGRGGKCAKRSQFARRDRVGRGLGDGGRSANAQNEPNFQGPGYPSIPVFHYCSVPIRCRLYKTKPIRPVVPGGPPPTLDPPASPLPRRLRKTNPISGPAWWDEALGAETRGKCAKRTQFR